MKPKMNRKDLLNSNDIWNGVIHAISEIDYPTEDQTLNDAFTVFQYYSEMESGGHESLFT